MNKRTQVFHRFNIFLFFHHFSSNN